MEEALAAFAQTADGVYAVDPRGKIILWNQGAKGILGYYPWEVLGRNCYEVIGGRDPNGSTLCDRDCPIILSCQRGELVNNYDVIARRNDGREAWINMSILALQSPGRKLTAVVHIFRPLVNPQKLEQEPYLAIYALGGFEVRRQNVPLFHREWRRKKTRGLFKYLVTHRSQWISRELVTDIFWPDMDPPRAIQNFRVAVSSLRKTLEPYRRGREPSQFLLIQGDQIKFNPGGDCWLDIDEFESRIMKVAHLPPKRMGHGDIDNLSRALELYRGDYLVEDAYSDWAAPERERLRNLYLKALARVADYHQFLGNYEQAIYWRRRLVEEEPWDEKAHQELMRDLARAGQRAIALKQYHLCREILAKELEVEPEKATYELYERILEGKSV